MPYSLVARDQQVKEKIDEREENLHIEWGALVAVPLCRVTEGVQDVLGQVTS